MLTLIDALSLAGSRNRQNDDSWGLTLNRAFVIDGATDLHDDPISGERSDAAWLSRISALALCSAPSALLGSSVLEDVSSVAASKWKALAGAQTAPLWKHPLAAALIVTETPEGLDVLDVGDCRIFIAAGSETIALGDGHGRAQESTRAAQLGVQAKEFLDLTDMDRMTYLRVSRSRANEQAMALGLRPPATAFTRHHVLKIARQSLCLIATDGFSSLVDVYGAYSPQTILDAAFDKGLASLASELRQIEANDPHGERFARWKCSDDATALLFRYE